MVARSREIVARSAVVSLGIARWLVWWKLSYCQARVVAIVARMRRRILAMVSGGLVGDWKIWKI
jgi:hypothetical protein